LEFDPALLPARNNRGRGMKKFNYIFLFSFLSAIRRSQLFAWSPLGITPVEAMGKTQGFTNRTVQSFLLFHMKQFDQRQGNPTRRNPLDSLTPKSATTTEECPHFYRQCLQPVAKAFVDAGRTNL